MKTRLLKQIRKRYNYGYSHKKKLFWVRDFIESGTPFVEYDKLELAIMYMANKLMHPIRMKRWLNKIYRLHY